MIQVENTCMNTGDEGEGGAGGVVEEEGLGNITLVMKEITIKRYSYLPHPRGIVCIMVVPMKACLHLIQWDMLLIIRLLLVCTHPILTSTLIMRCLPIANLMILQTTRGQKEEMLDLK